MGIPSAGAVIVVRFPFSDLSQSKARPAICLAQSAADEWIVCQVTSNPFGDPQAIQILPDDVSGRRLRTVSYARPGKLFTLDSSIVLDNLGTLDKRILRQLLESVAEFFKPG